MHNNHDSLPKPKPVTVVMLIDGKAETVFHDLVEDPQRLRRQFLSIGETAPELHRNSYRHRRGCPGKPVVITDVDESVLSRYAHAGAPHPEQVRANPKFASMTALSEFLGCARNRCALAAVAARTRGEDEATVRGVTFRLLESFQV